ncbi:DNA cross-link repair 1A protein [Drosophila tropicalis]|uniref:DNA cross-link repair 1A protein n=1 Tax=Drosophila tropicalis TaxID=46794 RepID=UPI0035ABDDA8
MATSNVGKIRLKNLNELQKPYFSENSNSTVATECVVISPETPNKVSKASRGRRAATTVKKKRDANIENGENTKKIVANTTVKRANKKEPPQGQMRIDSFFKSAAKNYSVAIDVPMTKLTSSSENKKKTTNRVPRKGRKRLFQDETTTSTSTTTTNAQSDETEPKVKLRSRFRKQPLRNAKVNNVKTESNEVIDLCSDEDDENHPVPIITPKRCLEPLDTNENIIQEHIIPSPVEINKDTITLKRSTEPLNANDNIIQELTMPSPVNIEKPTNSRRPRGSPKPCPPYKIVEGTNFCVDGFQFGIIPNVTHYFLSHYHADHYIGLTRKFSLPIYMSPTTARLVRMFIKVDDVYINEIDIDQTIIIDNIEITAIDANHCPGALMFFFKLSSGQTILHTGDFRANSDMESLPIFWNNPQLDVLYLDTTYLNKNYDFCHQSESIDRAISLVQEFHNKHRDKRILHVCGAYVIGKEKIWLTVAKEFQLKVWTEPHRRTAIDCLHLPDAETYLYDDPNEANFHIIGLGQISYPSLVQYFDLYQDKYDMILALRPSGWEKNRKPSYGKRISVIGIEYSEHSSYKELERFVRFLKPHKVISTVPTERDLFVTGKVPTHWYNYKGHASMMSKAFQPSITIFLKNTPQIQKSKKSSICNSVASNEMLLSPLSQSNTKENDGNANVTILSASVSHSPVQDQNESQPVTRLTSDASDDMLSFL